MDDPADRSSERKRYRQYYNDDGVTEICLGAGVLLAGLTVSPKSPAAVLWLMLAVVANTLVKKWAIAPRLEASGIDADKVRATTVPADSSKRAAIKAVTVIIAAIVFVLYLLLAAWKSKISSDFLQQPAFLVVAVVSGCFGAGYQYQAPRLFVYGALTAILFVTSLFSDLPLRSIPVFTGLVMVLTGGVFLFRFLSSHPRPPGDD